MTTTVLCRTATSRGNKKLESLKIAWLREEKSPSDLVLGVGAQTRPIRESASCLPTGVRARAYKCILIGYFGPLIRSSEASSTDAVDSSSRLCFCIGVFYASCNHLRIAGREAASITYIGEQASSRSLQNKITSSEKRAAGDQGR